MQSYLDNITELSKQLGVQKDLHVQHELEVCCMKERLSEHQGLINLLEKETEDLKRSNESLEEKITTLDNEQEILKSELAT